MPVVIVTFSFAVYCLMHTLVLRFVLQEAPRISVTRFLEQITLLGQWRSHSTLDFGLIVDGKITKT